MAFQVRWSYQASIDRIEILEYWFKRIGTKTYSNKLNAKFIHCINHLSKFPFSGRLLHDREERFFVVETYLIVYTTEIDTINILRIFDGRRNPVEL